MSNEKNTGFLTFLSGAVIGAALGIIFAPQSGKETRKQLRDVSEKTGDEIKVRYESVSSETKKGIDAIKKVTEDAVKNIKDFIEGLKSREKTTEPKKKPGPKKPV